MPASSGVHDPESDPPGLDFDCKNIKQEVSMGLFQLCVEGFQNHSVYYYSVSFYSLLFHSFVSIKVHNLDVKQ